MPVSNGPTPEYQILPAHGPDQPAIISSDTSVSALYRIHPVGGVRDAIRRPADLDTLFAALSTREPLQLLRVDSECFVVVSLHEAARTVVPHLRSDALAARLYRLRPLLEQLWRVDPVGEEALADLLERWQPEKMLFGEGHVRVDTRYEQLLHVDWPTHVDGGEADWLWQEGEDRPKVISMLVRALPVELILSKLCQRIDRISEEVTRAEREGLLINLRTIQQLEDSRALVRAFEAGTSMPYQVETIAIVQADALEGLDDARTFAERSWPGQSRVFEMRQKDAWCSTFPLGRSLVSGKAVSKNAHTQALAFMLP